SLLKQKGELAVRGNIHVGSGFDVHCLVPSRKLILCGVTIPYELGLDGYSDADVALHALMDAMLGAVGMGDIGKYFPDSDEKFKDADSMELLRYTVKLLAVAGWKVGNADITIIAQQPKISPYREQMEANLRKELNLAVDALNVKATTTEMLGFVGRKEGIAAQAIVTVIGKK
ncbi:MAG: 2-C-methyl-D-erythritol 2,4-cyclodiphosphate synthase, partial [Acidaminococcaceae bacterium]|nr:2-C-methyl-D-erythritol 2,4-cyclodiphosphate synthase [Acidaminococcaceae bacterium]